MLARAAVVEATWTGAAGTASYAAAANWDGVHDVTDLTLGAASTLTIAPAERPHR